MITTILTRSGGILGPIASLFGIIMNAIYEFFNMFGVQNIALCIIVFTFITRALMLPLTIKQQKFTKLSSKMNPELQRIQAKYKGKKDEASLRKQQEETNAVYTKYGANPMAGCLPLLITFPIIFALYKVINNIPAYVGDVYNLYGNIADAIKETNGYKDILVEMANGLAVSTKNFSELADGVISKNHVIDILSKFDTTQWETLKQSFPTVKDVITTNSNVIMNSNSLFGFLNIANKPGWGFPGILIPIIAALAQFVQTKQISIKNNNAKDGEDSSAAMMNSMNTFMPIMSGIFCVMLPIGVGLYWIASSVFAIVQQFFVNRYMDHIDVDDLIQKNLSKAVKKGSSSSSGTSLQELARTQTKNIITEYETSSEQVPKKAYQPSNYDKDNISVGSGSISDIANMLKNNNGDKGGR